MADACDFSERKTPGTGAAVIMNRELFDYIGRCTSPCVTMNVTAQMLEKEGFDVLYENEKWNIEPGGRYYTVRGGTSLIAFAVPKEEPCGFMMTASHCDSPVFRIKENSCDVSGGYVRLSVEKYGGMLCSPWFDRPLSVSGRVTVRCGNGFEVRNADLRIPCALIPSVAIHMNRNANEEAHNRADTDLLPLYSAGDSGVLPLRQRVSECLGVSENDIVSTELYLYNPQQGTEWGDFISAPRLDDLQCAFAALKAFVRSGESSAVRVFCLFDNEEVGSSTKQGAASTFLSDVIGRVTRALGGKCEREHILRANSFLVSCDNAHAVHPNHPEFADKNHSVRMNGGVVIKHNANQKYATDAVSAALIRLICEKAGVPVQDYANRADMPGGSTLGCIADVPVSVTTADIGLAQLAMHSCCETAGAKDTEYLYRALSVFYGSALEKEAGGRYILF